MDDIIPEPIWRYDQPTESKIYLIYCLTYASVVNISDFIFFYFWLNHRHRLIIFAIVENDVYNIKH